MVISIAKIPKEESRRRFVALPPEVQDALLADETTAAIHEVARKHALHIDQEDMLYRVFTATVEGFVPVNDFVPSLSTEAALDTKTATAIVDELNHKILDGIRMKMHADYNNSPPPEVTVPENTNEDSLDPTEVGSLAPGWKGDAPKGAGMAMIQNQLASDQSPAKKEYPADPYLEPVDPKEQTFRKE
jgi:hypothetical protein